MIEDFTEENIKAHQDLYYKCCRELTGLRPWVHKRNLHLILEKVNKYMSREKVRLYVAQFGAEGGYDLCTFGLDEDHCWGLLGKYWGQDKETLIEKGWLVVPVIVTKDE